MLIFNSTGTFTYGSVAAAHQRNGQLIVKAADHQGHRQQHLYRRTRIDAGATFQPREGQDGALASPVITNNGTLSFVRQDALFIYAGNIGGTGQSADRRQQR